MFKNRLLVKIFGHKRQEVKEAGENCVLRSFMF
jgi:hypothetical protein